MDISGTPGSFRFAATALSSFRTGDSADGYVEDQRTVF